MIRPESLLHHYEIHFILIVVSIGDQVAYVYRNGIQIGQPPIGVNRSGSLVSGGVFLMLEGDSGVPSPVVPGRVMRSWPTLSLEASASPDSSFPENQKSTDKTRFATGFTILN